MVVRDAKTGVGMVACLEQELMPTRIPEQVIVLDNLHVHRHVHVRARACVREVIEAAGCAVRYLPSSSPDHAPIEYAVGKLIGHPRQEATRSVDTLVRAIGAPLQQITAVDADDGVHDCG